MISSTSTSISSIRTLPGLKATKPISQTPKEGLQTQTDKKIQKELIIKSLTRGLKSGKAEFKSDLQEDISRIDTKLEALSYENYSLISNKDTKLNHLKEKTEAVKQEFADLSLQLSYFIKRNLYNEEKKSEIDTSRANLGALKTGLGNVRLMLTSFERINQAVSHSQFTSAIRLINKLEESGLAEKMSKQNFGFVFSRLKQKLTQKLER